MIERRVPGGASLDYPVDLATVRERLGDAVLEAPNAADSLTVADVLAHLDDETFASATALDEALAANLPEQYVGRKYTSGRGIVVDETYGPRDEPNQSL